MKRSLLVLLLIVAQSLVPSRVTLARPPMHEPAGSLVQQQYPPGVTSPAARRVYDLMEFAASQAEGDIDQAWFPRRRAVSKLMVLLQDGIDGAMEHHVDCGNRLAQRVLAERPRWDQPAVDAAMCVCLDAYAIELNALEAWALRQLRPINERYRAAVDQALKPLVDMTDTIIDQARGREEQQALLEAHGRMVDRLNAEVERIASLTGEVLQGKVDIPRNWVKDDLKLWKCRVAASAAGGDPVAVERTTLTRSQAPLDEIAAEPEERECALDAASESGGQAFDALYRDFLQPEEDVSAEPEYPPGLTSDGGRQAFDALWGDFLQAEVDADQTWEETLTELIPLTPLIGERLVRVDDSHLNRVATVGVRAATERWNADAVRMATCAAITVFESDIKGVESWALAQSTPLLDRYRAAAAPIAARLDDTGQYLAVTELSAEEVTAITDAQRGFAGTLRQRAEGRPGWYEQRYLPTRFIWDWNWVQADRETWGCGGAR